MLNCYEETTIRNSQLPIEWQSQIALDELSEFLQFNWEQRSVFYDDGEITSRQQFISFGGKKSIHPNNYVGTIVFKGQQLNIFPKVFRIEKDDNEVTNLSLTHLMKNLVQWIEYCNKISYPYISITSELDHFNDLRELFVSLYIRYVQAALDRSLFYQYEEETEDCLNIKGKFNVRDYICKKVPNGITNKFACTYSNFEFDNLLNQIIKNTCKHLMNEVSKENQKILRHILIKLNEVSDRRCIPSDCDKIRLSRMHGYYKVILSMSKMFLLNQTSSYNVDKNESFCFLFPTEVLFEGFIGGFMQSVLQDEATVKLQSSDLTVFSDIKYAGQSIGRSHRMKHDILVEYKDKGLFVLDTKYKAMERFDGNEDLHRTIENEVKSGDIYQVITYARTRSISDVYLIYPLFRYEENEPNYPYGINTTVSGADPINVHLVRVPFVFEDDIENVKIHLREAIEKIFS